MQHIEGVTSAFLSKYMDYVEDTEPPRIMHAWAAMSGISAALGRRCYFKFGYIKLYPNQYVVLVGNPAVRKSIVLQVQRKLLNNLPIRFAAEDVQGRRGELIRQMMATSNQGMDDEYREADGRATFIDGLDPDFLGGVSATEQVGDLKFNGNHEDEQVLYINAEELANLVGQTSKDMITFLNRVWEGNEYPYSQNGKLIKLETPLLNMLTCATRDHMALAMPNEAIGQGFTSRVIFVHGPHRYKRVARPKELSKSETKSLQSIYEVVGKMKGAFSETEEAAEYLDSLYDGYTVRIEDTRFSHYADRRHTHLIKLGLAFCASRIAMESPDDLSMLTVTKQDYVNAHNMLAYTELDMSDALGEYGLNPYSIGKGRVLEILRNSGEPLTKSTLYMYVSRDLRKADFEKALMELLDAKSVEQVKVKIDDGHGHIVDQLAFRYNDVKKKAKIKKLASQIKKEKQTNAEESEDI